MLVDNVKVTFKAGDGGDGKVSFKRVGKGADGGSGGKGGDLYVVASSDLTLLNQFTRLDYIKADDGIAGSYANRDGKGAKDLEIKLPVGTEIIDQKNNHIVAVLEKVGQRVLLCKGGQGGLGNYDLKKPGIPPTTAEKGKPGQRLLAVLNLKLIADYGLIGLPNSGKSSLLNELTGTSVKTANYPFTTLSPNLGVINGKIIADIPGLIEGAAQGKGLGVFFLKHIEKVKVLIHCIDSTTKDAEADYQIVRKELGEYNKELLNKKEVILMTKSDLIDKPISFRNGLPISIHDFNSIEKVKKLIT